MFNSATGNSQTGGTIPWTGIAAVSPGGVASTNVLGTLNFNGWATSNFTQVAGINQGGGFNSNNAMQIQSYAAENFADTTLAISQPTLTSVSRITTGLTSVSVTGTKGQISHASTTESVGSCIVVTGTNTGTSTGITAGTYYVIASNGSTTAQLSATAGGVPITTTAGTTTGLTFTRELITVNYSAQSNIPFGLNALIAVSGINNVTNGTYMEIGRAHV